MGKKRSQKDEASEKVIRVTRYLVFLVLLGLGVYLVLPQINSLRNSYQVIKDMIIWVVMLAILAQVASYLGSGYLLKALVQLSGNSLSILKGTMITLAGASLGMMAGGVVGRSAGILRWMDKEDIDPDAATLAGTFPVLFNDIVLMAVTLVGLVYLFAIHRIQQLTRWQVISFGLILVFLIGLIVLLALGRKKRESIIGFAEKMGRRWAQFRHQEYKSYRIKDWLGGIFDALDILLKGGWRGPLLGAVVNVAFDMLTLFLLFFAAKNPVAPGVFLTGYGIPLLMARVAFMIPGGVGVVESAMTALYTSLGVPYSTAVVVVLSYRMISFWLPLALGFPIILFLEGKAESSGRKKESGT